MLDNNGNKVIQIFYCPKCEKDKGYVSRGYIVGTCFECGSKIHYTFEKAEENERD